MANILYPWNPYIGLNNISSLKIYMYIFIFQISFRNTIRLPNSLDPDQGFVAPDLDSNCLQKLSVDDTSRYSVR